MQKTKSYPHVFFRPEHIAEIAKDFMSRLDDKSRESLRLNMRVDLPGEHWVHNEESEFFSDILKDGADYSYRLLFLYSQNDLIIYGNNRGTTAVVAAPMRKDVEGVFQVIERLAPLAELPVLDYDFGGRPVAVFIGHGQNPQWRDLKDHLHEKHGYEVAAYEIGARAGHAIRDVLEDMLKSSSMALLVMTGEDETAAGELRARQNVIHEIGLFQGRLGFAKAVVLLEDGVEEFSNIHGIHQIHFGKGKIRETFGDVVATIRREFPENVA